MAIQKTIDFKGISVEDAYIRIVSAMIIKINVSDFTCSLSVSKKSSKTSVAFDSATYEFPFDIGGENPYAQGYAYLKTLDEFQGAVDV